MGALLGGPGSPDPETLRGNSVTPLSLIQRAFDLKTYQVSGPDWINSSRYDVTAKISSNTSPEDFRWMLQFLLEERFGFRSHREAREVRGYNLVAARDGLKWKDKVTTDPCAAGARLVGKNCPPGTEPLSGIAIAGKDARGTLIVITGVATGSGVPTATLIRMLENEVRPAPVIDRTGLTEKYDLRFEFSPPDVGVQGEFAYPSIFTALEKDLGMKLEPARIQLDVLVIDHIEQPSAN